MQKRLNKKKKKQCFVDKTLNLIFIEAVVNPKSKDLMWPLVHLFLWIYLLILSSCQNTWL